MRKIILHCAIHLPDARTDPLLQGTTIKKRDSQTAPLIFFTPGFTWVLCSRPDAPCRMGKLRQPALANSGVATAAACYTGQSEQPRTKQVGGSRHRDCGSMRNTVDQPIGGKTHI